MIESLKAQVLLRSQISDPMAFGPDGNLYFSTANLIWKIPGEGGNVQTVVGHHWGAVSAGFSGDGGPAAQAKIDGPAGLGFDAEGNLYFADQVNNRIRRVSKDSGIITTVAGNGRSRSSTDPRTAAHREFDDGEGGPAMQAMITRPSGIAFDRAGNLYTCSAGMLRKITSIGGPFAAVFGSARLNEGKGWADSAEHLLRDRSRLVWRFRMTALPMEKSLRPNFLHASLTSLPGAQMP